MKMKKILSMLLACFMLFTFIPNVAVSAIGTFAEGYGTYESPFIITSEAQFDIWISEVTPGESV